MLGKVPGSLEFNAHIEIATPAVAPMAVQIGVKVCSAVVSADKHLGQVGSIKYPLRLNVTSTE